MLLDWEKLKEPTFIMCYQTANFCRTLKTFCYCIVPACLYIYILEQTNQLIMAQYFCKRSRSRSMLKIIEPEPGSFFTGWYCLKIFVFRDYLKGHFWTANSLSSCMRFRDWILIMYLFIMCLFIFEEKAEVQNPESNQSVIRPEIKIDATYDLFH